MSGSKDKLHVVLVRAVQGVYGTLQDKLHEIMRSKDVSGSTRSEQKVSLLRAAWMLLNTFSKVFGFKAVRPRSTSNGLSRAAAAAAERLRFFLSGLRLYPPNSFGILRISRRCNYDVLQGRCNA